MKAYIVWWSISMRYLICHIECFREKNANLLYSLTLIFSMLGCKNYSSFIYTEIRSIYSLSLVEQPLKMSSVIKKKRLEEVSVTRQLFLSNCESLQCMLKRLYGKEAETQPTSYILSLSCFAFRTLRPLLNFCLIWTTTKIKSIQNALSIKSNYH